jgi:DNA-binding NarL/FixJ family response regulator
MTRVLIVDDHPLFRDGLAGLLATLPEMEVTGTAGTAEEAVEALSSAVPDVVLMDINLPGASGVEATRWVSRRSLRSRDRQPAPGPGVRPAIEPGAATGLP